MAEAAVIQPDIDLFDLPEEEFMQQYQAAQAAAKAAGVTNQDGVVIEQPRNEKGQFVSQQPKEQTETEPEVEAAPETQEVDEIVYRKVIDLGDGAGVQVFEGETPEELIEKLATAQEHATRKIRELSAARKAQAEPVIQTKPLTADEEWLLGQELTAKPSETTRKLFEQIVGMPIDKFKTKLQRIDAFEKAQVANNDSKKFVETHPEYPANEYNATRMQSYLKVHNLEENLENYEKAFTVLNEGGLLKANAVEQQQEPTEQAPTTRERIAQPSNGTRTVVIQKRQAASGISAKRSSASAPQPMTVEDLYNMPEEEFFKLGGMSKQDNW